MLGHKLTFERLCLVADLTEKEGLAALDEALRSRLFHEAEKTAGGAAREEEYAFAHDKVRAVVYAEENETRRRLFHGRALEALRGIGSATELARHAWGARLPEPAFRHSVAAGDAASALFAVHEAIAHYERARQVMEESPADSALRHALSISDLRHLYISLGGAYAFATEWEKAGDAYRTLLSLARDQQDPAAERAALNALANLAVHRSYDLVAARSLLKEALRVAGAEDDRAGLAETEWNLAQIEYYAWNSLPSLEHAVKALKLAREMGEEELAARSLYAISNARWRLGDWEEAEARAEEGRALYTRLGDRAMEAACLRQTAIARIHYGRPRAGIRAARAARESSLEIEDRWARAHSTRVLALGLIEAGEYEEALRLAREGVSGARELDHPVMLLITLHALGRANHALFALDDGRDAYLEALAISEENGIPPYTATIASQLCAICTLSGDPAGAHAYALRALETRDTASLLVTDFARWHETEAMISSGEAARAREDARLLGERAGDNRRYRIPYLRMLAALDRSDGETGRALGHLREATGLARYIGLPGELWQAEAMLGELYENREEHEESTGAFARAASVVEPLIAGLEDERLRKTFSRAPQVRRVLERRRASR